MCVTDCVVVREQLLKAGGWEKKGVSEAFDIFSTHVRFLSNHPKLQLLGP